MKLNHRITVLISLVQELQDHISDQSIHKLLFIYCHKYACNNAYDFILYKNNPYSLTVYEDKKLLVQKGILQDLVSWIPNPEAFRFAKNLDMLEKLSLQKLKNDIEKGLIIDKVINQNYHTYFRTLEIEADKKIFYTIG
jgi:hypothetical protein